MTKEDRILIRVQYIKQKLIFSDMYCDIKECLDGIREELLGISTMSDEEVRGILLRLSGH